MYKSVALLFDPDNPWIFDYFDKNKIDTENADIKHYFTIEKVKGFDFVFLLGNTMILPETVISQNNLVLLVHESDVPEGKGFAPIQWQILENKSKIVVSLIQATNKVDSGDIFLQSEINFDGTELYHEIRDKQARATHSLISQFLATYPDIKPKRQHGPETFYRRRTPKDGELDVTKSIAENFNLLRIGNNEEWPSYFWYRGCKYILKITKE